jgi:hypothetical protein
MLWLFFGPGKGSAIFLLFPTPVGSAGFFCTSPAAWEFVAVRDEAVSATERSEGTFTAKESSIQVRVRAPACSFSVGRI